MQPQTGYFLEYCAWANHALNINTQKNRLIETVLLRTHNMCFSQEIIRIIFDYTLLSGGLNYLYKFYNFIVLSRAYTSMYTFYDH